MGVQTTISQNWFSQAIIWTNDDLFTDAYASLGLNELK